MLDQLRQDAQVWDQLFAERMEERDAAAAAALADTSAEMMAKLDSLMKNMSASVDVKNSTSLRHCAWDSAYPRTEVAGALENV